MSKRKLPSGNSRPEVLIRTTAELGQAVQRWRKEQKLLQLHVAGLANTGNRFIVDLENGKPTIQFQKVLAALDVLGIDVILRKRGAL